MKITHETGESLDTDKLPDVDAILMEESKRLHELFAKYNRQLFLVGEMRGGESPTPHQGCVFFHLIQKPEEGKELEETALREAHGKYWGRIDAYVRGLSRYQLGIGPIPPPQVQPYPEPSND